MKNATKRIAQARPEYVGGKTKKHDSENDFNLCASSSTATHLNFGRHALPLNDRIEFGRRRRAAAEQLEEGTELGRWVLMRVGVWG
jgi:hypothetical protein